MGIGRGSPLTAGPAALGGPVPKLAQSLPPRSQAWAPEAASEEPAGPSSPSPHAQRLSPAPGPGRAAGGRGLFGWET